MNNNSISENDWIPVESKKHYGHNYANKHNKNIIIKSYERPNNIQKNIKHDNSDDKIDNSDDYFQNRKNKGDNYKKILCKNININGKCIYNNKCLYAHSLDEQNVEPVRLIAYNMIKKSDNLSEIDLSKSKQIYNTLLSLTRICPQCETHTCTGGYNCKHGACNNAYVVCQTDLNKGTCDGSCGKVHLTKKGLTPYGLCVMKNLKTRVVLPKPKIINEDFFLNDNNKNDHNKNDHMYDIDTNKTVSINWDNKSDDSSSDDILLPNLDCDDDDSSEYLNYNSVIDRENKLTKSIFKVNIDS